MSAQRWRTAGIAEPRAPWFSSVASWSTSAAIPVDFVKCVSASELRTRFAVGETYEAVLVGARSPGVDRGLIAEARDRGAAVIMVGSSGARSYLQLGASTVLPESFERDDLMAALAEHAAPAASDRPGLSETASPWRGQLVCATGSGGAGSSLLAMCLATELAADASNRGLVVLADLALNADQAMMHDSRDVMPGVQELAEACATGRLGRDALRSMVFRPAGRGYDLLLGVRRRRDWTAIRDCRPESILDSLLGAYRLVVADVDADVEDLVGMGPTCAASRSLLSRDALRGSDVTVVVGTADAKGICSLVRTIDTLTHAGVAAQRLVPVINRLPRNPRRQSAAVTAVVRLLEDTTGAAVVDPLLVVERRSVERAIRDGVAPPPSVGRTLADAVRGRLRSADPDRRHGPGAAAATAQAPTGAIR